MCLCAPGEPGALSIQAPLSLLLAGSGWAWLGNWELQQNWNKKSHAGSCPAIALWYGLYSLVCSWYLSVAMFVPQLRRVKTKKIFQKGLQLGDSNSLFPTQPAQPMVRTVQTANLWQLRHHQQAPMAPLPRTRPWARQCRPPRWENSCGAVLVQGCPRVPAAAACGQQGWAGDKFTLSPPVNPSLAVLGRSEQGWTLLESGGRSLIPHLLHRFTVATFSLPSCCSVCLMYKGNWGFWELC